MNFGGRSVQTPITEAKDHEDYDKRANQFPPELDNVYSLMPWKIYQELGPEFLVRDLFDYLDRYYSDEEDEWIRIKTICMALRQGYARFRSDEQKLTKEVNQRERNKATVGKKHRRR